MAFAVGIDLGTTNSVVGVVKDGVVATIADPGGSRLIPSVVSFHPSGNVLVGQGALERRLNDASNTIYSVKRLIGRPWGSAEVEQARGKLPFELREGPNGAILVAARGQTFSLPEISAFVLRQAKAVAEASLGEPVERAVITVPANFNDLQRAATKTAGRLAGIDVLRILNEPTAAALAYGPSGNDRERVAVYDLGGGTFDVTILDLAGNVFEVLSTAGDTALGGDDIDVVIAERMADDLLKKHRFDARAQPLVFARLRILAEGLKQELSGAAEHTISVDDLVPGDRGSTVKWEYRMTRPELEWASLALVERTFKVCQQALDSCGAGAGELDRVILVGGATRMPMVARKVEQFFGRAPVVRINPDEVVGLGAAIQATLLDRARKNASEPLAHPRIAEESVVQALPDEEDISAEVEPSLPVIIAAEPARPPPPPPPAPARPPPAPPAKQVAQEQFLPSGGRSLVFDVPEEKAASPYEVDLPPARPKTAPARTIPGVPLGPTATAVMPVAPRVRSPLLIDVTPLSLGVETVGGFCDTLIDANTPVPCDRTRNFSTATAGQTTVQVRVSQGGSKRFEENTCLGELELSGITPGARGEHQIAVTFEIDADGILQVRARDVTSGRQASARMQLVGAQAAPSDIEAMQARQAANPLAPLEAPRTG